ncbi:hypothetical protein BP5796_11915 [Coleophoma crateriformis]|uniref:Uncharacterized protein n=1 Tax=Coleophoma crateriformis TaxID=565419 RepID=A0A3D8QER0_9HELO|nr:hypothetical protein BP5796_11915 [Coleophoma crateriformis]
MTGGPYVKGQQSCHFSAPDHSFHYRLRNLAAARYQDADIAEVLSAAGKIEAGILESLYAAFYDFAQRVDGQGQAIDSSQYPVSAETPTFAPQLITAPPIFTCNGTPSDPRINTFWELQTAAFDKALALLDIPGQRLTPKSDGFNVEAIFYAAPGASPSNPKLTINAGTGYDGPQEELLHSVSFAALELGYNVITYEGPGQPSVLRQQKSGFIAERRRSSHPWCTTL